MAYSREAGTCVFRTATALALLLMGSLGAASAHAETMIGVKSIDMLVHGTIAQHCAMGGIGDMKFGDLTRPDLQASVAVQFSCNVPFRVKVQAANGGLTNTAFPHGQGPYAGSLPYTIGFAIPVLKPAEWMVDRSFNSRELTGGRTFDSAGGIATRGMKLDVALGRPSGDAGLLAGDYSETIVITVTPD